MRCFGEIKGVSKGKGLFVGAGRRRISGDLGIRKKSDLEGIWGSGRRRIRGGFRDRERR